MDRPEMDDCHHAHFRRLCRRSHAPHATTTHRRAHRNNPPRRTQRPRRADDRSAPPLADHRAAWQPQGHAEIHPPPGRSLSLSAEAQVDLDASGSVVPLAAAIEAAHESNTGGLPFSSLSVAILIGPADGPVTAKAVLDAAKEANVKGYRHLYVIGFAITADARENVDGGEDVLGLPATFVAATMDLQMGDLLKNQRSSQIFSVCGAPDIEVIRVAEPAEDGTPRWQVKLLGLDVFDPITMQPHHAAGDDVPCWMLDTAYNGMVFHADQVFFPKTAAWDSLRKALKATHDDAVWQHLAGDTSAPFARQWARHCGEGDR